MISSIEEFAHLWEYESNATRKVFGALTDASLAQAVAKDHRTLGRIAWHITTAVSEMMERTGLKLAGPAPEAPLPATAEAIRTGYDAAAASLLVEMRKHWTDATLLETDDMYGEKWARAQTLSVLLGHQTHHRGQMTVLMRQAGLRVPGFYGPAREDWAKMGAQPPEI